MRYSEYFLNRLNEIERDLIEDGVPDTIMVPRHFRQEDIVRRELLALAHKASQCLAEDARLLHRESLLRISQASWEPIDYIISELRVIFENALFRINDTKRKRPTFTRQVLALFRSSARRVERRKLRLAFHQVRQARYELEQREKKGFEPDELKLIASLSERLTQTWPFRSAYYAAAAAAVFAITGSIVIGNSSRNFFSEVQDQTDKIGKRAGDFNHEAKRTADEMQTIYDKLASQATEIKNEIINQVVSKMTDEFAKSNGELAAKLERDKSTEVGLSSDLAKMHDTVSTEQKFLAEMSGLHLEIDNVKSNVDSELKNLKSSSDAASDAAKQVALWAEDADAKRKAAASSMTQIDAIRQQLTSLEAELKGRMKDTTVDENRSAVAAREADLASKVIDAITLLSRIEKLEHRLDPIENTMNSLADASKRLSLLEDRVAEMGRPNSDLETQAMLKLLGIELRDQVEALDKRLNAAENSLQSFLISQPPDISYLQESDCRQVQLVLVERGYLLLSRKAHKPVAADGKCGAKTNSALLTWQRRENRALAPAHTVSEIIQRLRSPGESKGL